MGYEMAKKLVCGVGFNDADYGGFHKVDGKAITCPYYRRWRNRLKRCYWSNTHSRQPTYLGCKGSEDWFSFVSFKTWMESQDWKGKYLDKDVIGDGVVYSKNTCVFISLDLNAFMNDHGARRGDCPIGVNRYGCRFVAKVSISGTQKH